MIRVESAASATLAVPTEKFLQEVEKRPCLWDPRHKEYRNLPTRRHAFRLIATILMGKKIPEKKLHDIGISLSRKWKHIRDYWVKVKSNPSNVKCQDNQYFKILKFLEPTIASEILKQQAAKGSGVSSGDSNRSTPIKTNSLTKSSVTSSQDEEDGASRPLSYMAKRKRTSSRSSSATGSQHCTNDSKQRFRSAQEQKLSEESRSTVFIDGVEFEQVTLENGEVVVKLKEEKLEDDLPSKRKEKRKKRPVHKDGHSSESAVRSQQVCQSVDLELAANSEHPLQDGRPPEDQEPGIDCGVVIEGPTVEIPWSSTEATPTKKVHVDLGCVEDLKKLVTLPPKLNFHDSSDNKFQPAIKKEPIEEPDTIEISDDDSSCRNLNDHNPSKDNSEDSLGRWNAKLDRLVAQPLRDVDGKKSTDSPSSDDALLRTSCLRSQSQSYAKLKRKTAQPGSDGDRPNAKDESSNDSALRPSKYRSLLTRRTEKSKGPVPLPVAEADDKSNDSRSGDDAQLLPSKYRSRLASTHRTEKPKGPVPQPVAEADYNKSSDSQSSDDAQLRPSKYRSRLTSTHRIEKLKRPVPHPEAEADDKSNDSRSSDYAQHQSSRSRSSSKSVEELSSEKVDLVDERSSKVKSSENEDDEDNKKFLMWFLPEMRTMTETQNYEFRLEVMQALSRAKYS